MRCRGENDITENWSRCFVVDNDVVVVVVDIVVYVVVNVVVDVFDVFVDVVACISKEGV